MAQANRINSVAECFAHALTIEREAAARYAEFAELLAELGNEKTALLFRRLASFEREHTQALERQSRGLPLPDLEDWQYSWLDSGPPETADHNLVFHLMTPYEALKLALGAERRAAAFFDHLAAAAPDGQVKALAELLATDERSHIADLEAELARTPPPMSADEPLDGAILS